MNSCKIPQIVGLIDRGNLHVEAGLEASLRAVDYFATLALLIVVEGQTQVPEPGGIQLADGPFSFVADNARKGISAVRALTLHAEHNYSRLRFGDGQESIVKELLELAAPWIGDASVLETQLHRWRYAGPVQPIPARTEVIESPGGRIALAGDAFGGPKVEGAFNSGLAAAAALLAD